LEEKLQSVSTEVLPHEARAPQRRLEELRQALSALPTNEASAAICRFLDSKADASTGQGFKVGPDGSLEESPTFRVFLLDFLGRLDPAAAAAYVQVVLSSMDSPDKWAVALRSCAAANATAEGLEFVTQKLREMLRHEPWQRPPSVGYLEAFDVAVHAVGTELMPDRSQILCEPCIHIGVLTIPQHGKSAGRNWSPECPSRSWGQRDWST
jgi:hypothetical protein